ncbi:MAG: right-handed parallel beta-helix repeat-containing protein [Gemmatimonadetes bacterium]|nr:right-handed parallel beta-helix repeat-containing protein [Gemmatimonadota bacterium]
MRSRLVRILLSILAVLAALAVVARRTLHAQPAPVRPSVGFVVTHSTRIAPGTYRLPAGTSPDAAFLIVRGDGIVLDLTGVTFEGAPPSADPDAAFATAIRVEGGHKVEIRNGRIRGFKFGIVARHTVDLHVTGTDLSYNWKPRLFSLIEHESLADWLSFHHNEKDEWLRFGAALSLWDVDGGTISNVRAEQGMNGLMMTRTRHLRVTGSSFSFNSGLGVGMYRSSDNVIANNRIDYDVRGYSDRVYRRGQDSAGLLMFEQCLRNVVAYNSVTHGGDGLFIWAGQQTMDDGQGGVNDNVFVGNDFSYAPTNGMEATFSRNAFIGNRIAGSDHGFWGGYSYESVVAGNCFANNRIGIAVEHGQQNTVVANRFDGDTLAIRLWADSIEPGDWGYPKHRDTRSRDWRITRNVFAGNKSTIDAKNTTALDTLGNEHAPRQAAMCVPRIPKEFAAKVPALPGVTRAAPVSADARRPRSAIVIDEWGPYDRRSPKLTPLDSSHAALPRFVVMGPAGGWRVVGRRGLARVSDEAGKVGDTITVTPAPETSHDWELVLEYVGGATVSPRGEAQPAGVPVRFSYAHYEPRTEWNVRFFVWRDSTVKPTPEGFTTLMAGAPAFERRAPRLDYEWYRPAIKALPLEKWALDATTPVDIPAGEHSLRVISDDAARVWIDGVLVIDHWQPHESLADYAALTPGKHALRVQYYQLDGWTELRVDIVRGSARSMGSAGPH